MATNGERKALFFLTAVAVLGAGARAWHARHEPVPTAELDHQIGAVEAPVARGSNGGRRSSARKHGQASSPESGREPGGTVPVSSPKPDPARSTTRVDLDTAPIAEIERLPGIGPAIAKRIVAERGVTGAFGCLAALAAVRGIGPKRMGRLDSLVAFSGAPRPICVQR